LCDEIAFWMTDDAANPDHEILKALRPGMATIPNSMLLCASSPYAKRGALWDAHRKHYAKASPVLVWQADTRTMNPTVPQGVIDEAMADDPASAAAEYGAQFRSDIESYITREAVEACVDDGVYERPMSSKVFYNAFVDPAGGSGQDSMTLAIAHRERDIYVLDAIREIRPPFSPAGAVEELVPLLKAYRIRSLCGDRFAGEWAREPFLEHKIKYAPNAKPKADIYRDFLPLVNSGKVRLLDHPKLVTQICSLERKTARGGRDSIDHAPGAHDDLANAAAGALSQHSDPASAYTYALLHFVVGPTDSPSL
jgi:hypothetical protein